MPNGYLVLAGDSFQQATRTLAIGAAEFIPRLVIALVAFIVLWVVGIQLGKLIEQVVKSLKVDSLLESLGAGEPVARAGYKLNAGVFFGGIVKWFFVIIGLLVATDVLQLPRVSEFLSQIVLTYIPSVVIASLVIVAGAVIADITQKAIKGSAQAANIPAASFIGSFAKWSIWAFAIVIALDQLQVAEQITRIFQTVFTAFVAMIALAGGLAFGLGGKEHASDFIAKIKKDMK